MKGGLQTHSDYMVTKTLKNVLAKNQVIPFYKILPGETKTIELTENDIQFRGIELGHLIEVKREVKKEAIPKEPKTILKTSKKKKKS